MKFTAVKDFYAEETASQYVAGLSYNAGPDDRTLLGLVPLWLADGKITMGGTAAQVMGEGASLWP